MLLCLVLNSFESKQDPGLKVRLAKQNHNGNTPPKHHQKQTLERCFINLKDNNISIKHFRADSASYQKEVIELVEKNSTNFYVRNISSDSFSKHCNQIQDWETIEVNYKKRKVASILYAPFGSIKIQNRCYKNFKKG